MSDIQNMAKPRTNDDYHVKLFLYLDHVPPWMAASGPSTGRAGTSKKSQGSSLMPVSHLTSTPVQRIAIGRGLGSFEPELPDEFTADSLTEATRFSRSARDVLVGLGYQEMIFNYLGAHRDYTERMNARERVLVEVANPMTENYAVVRDSIIPCLLAAEMSSQNAAYPHRMFEVGKVALARRRRPHRLAHHRRLQPAGGGPRKVLASMLFARTLGAGWRVANLVLLFAVNIRQLPLDFLEVLFWNTRTCAINL